MTKIKKIRQHLKAIRQHAPSMPIRLVIINVLHIAKHG
jgi:hypothetical protein